MFSLFLLSALSASTYTIGKIVLVYCPPITLTALRLLLSGIMFMIYYHVKKISIPAFVRSDYFLYIQVAFFAFCAPYVLEFWALQYMSSAKTAFLYSLSPVVTAFLSFIFFHEKMTYKKGIGLLLSIAAAIPVLFSPNTAEEWTSLFYITLPEISVLIAMISFAYGWIVMRKAIKKRSFPIVFVNGVGMVIGGLGAAIMALIFEGSPSFITAMQQIPVSGLFSVILGIVGLVCIGNIACYMLYGYLLRFYTATLVTFGEQATPIFAMIYGLVFLHEHIDSLFLVSVLCLVSGIFIVYQEELRQGYFER